MASQYVYVAVDSDLNVVVGETKASLITAVQYDTGGHMRTCNSTGRKDADGNVISWAVVWRDDAGEEFTFYVTRERIR